jgi:alpha-ribazole phosphatase
MYIYLIRHPPPIEVDGLCYGRLDVPVNEPDIAGYAASVVAEIPSRTLASARVYSSPSARCLGLARHLAAPRVPAAAEELSEMNFGHWQGLRWDAIAREQIDAWAEDLWGYRPGGGESAEMVAVRWECWVHHICQSTCGDIVAVTHAGVIRVALARLSHGDASSALQSDIPFGSVHRLEVE